MSWQSDRATCVTVLGTRPEIIKCSPLLPELDKVFNHALIHTGQHYDDNMDGAFFRDLELRHPDHMLAVGSGSQATQLAGMLVGIEQVLTDVLPDIVVVQGDTNSTLAGGLAAAKLGIAVAHIEAGCRSFNRAMPEEINRVLVDHLAALCFAPDETAATNLRSEGIPQDRIEVVGSTGIDACLRASELTVDKANGHFPAEFLLTTIHRAENTTKERLTGLLEALTELARQFTVLFPVHPRTATVMETLRKPDNIQYMPPVSYPGMMHMLSRCRALLTDSGGLQEEAAVLGTPTFILRNETEWVEFVSAGRHVLVGTDPQNILEVVGETLIGGERECRMRQPVGRERSGAADRILASLLAHTDSTSAQPASMQLVN